MPRINEIARFLCFIRIFWVKAITVMTYFVRHNSKTKVPVHIITVLDFMYLRRINCGFLPNNRSKESVYVSVMIRIV